MSELTPDAPARERFIKPEWRRERIAAAYVGIVLTIAQAAFLVIARLLSVIWSYEDDVEPLGDWVRALALALSLGIVPALASIFLGWAALSEAWGGRMRTGVLGAISLGAGALFIVLWLSRLVDAAVSGSLGDEFGGFIFGPFWWA